VRKYTRRQRARYAFDNTMSRGTSALVIWLALATLGLVIVFTLVTLAARIAPENDAGDRPGFFRQIFNSLMHALDPGTVAGDSGGWPFLLTMLALTLAASSSSAPSSASSPRDSTRSSRSCARAGRSCSRTGTR
jgi:hypothetical protein